MGVSASTFALLDYVWSRIRGRLNGMSDDEYLWEPVPGCWSVRARNGTWEVEREFPPPQPEPFTTMAWRTWHIGAEVIDGYLRRGFGAEALELEPQQWFPTAGQALAAMDDAWTAFSAAFHELDDEAMAHLLGPDFGPWAEANRNDMLLHVADELIHHGAEVAMLRDLYTASAGGRSWSP